MTRILSEMKTDKLKSIYEERYEKHFVAISMYSGNVLDFDRSFIRLFTEIPEAMREKLFFFYVKDRNWKYIKIDI